MKTVLMMIALVLAGCSGSHVSSSSTGSEGAAGSNAGPYERTFVPSDHDPEDQSASNRGLHGGQTTSQDSVDSSGTLAEETIPGYRVQLLASTDIDEVSARKAGLEEAFPTEWFYVEFDPPVYKLRAGNFPSRYEAERFARALAAKGFPDAWAVPARVFRNPPPVPPRTPVPAIDSTGVNKEE
ncbi:MAG: SPOR domain-containing protein [Bacteroidota bacterium]